MRRALYMSGGSTIWESAEISFHDAMLTSLFYAGDRRG
jgi:hypothetical protein